MRGFVVLFNGLLGAGSLAARVASVAAAIDVANGANMLVLFGWATCGLFLMVLPDLLKCGPVAPRNERHERREDKLENEIRRRQLEVNCEVEYAMFYEYKSPST